MDTQAANRIWLPTQPRHYITRKKIPLSRQLLKMGTRWPETCRATYKEQLIRRNKYNTKWHLVGFLFHIFILVFLTVPCRWKTASLLQTKYKLSVYSSSNLGIKSLQMATLLTVLPSASTYNNFNLKGLKQCLSWSSFHAVIFGTWSSSLFWMNSCLEIG